MANAAQSDFLGEGTNAGVLKPYDPNDEPNPNNPGGLSNNEMMKLVARNRRSNAAGATLAGQGRQNVLNSGAKQVAPAPGKWGYSSTSESRGKTANAPNDVLGDIKKIWTSDPVTTAVLAAPYAVGAAGAAIPAAVGGVGGASAIPSTAATTGAANSAAAFAGAHAAPALGAVGTVASPFAAAAGTAGGAVPAMYAAQAANAGMSLKDWAKTALAGGVITKLIYDQITGDSSSGGGGAATTAPTVPANYGPSGGYIPPTARPPGAAQSGASAASQFASLSPQARTSLQNANQFAGANAFQGVPRATGSTNADLSRFNPIDQAGQNTTQQGIAQQQQLANRFDAQNTAAQTSYAQTGAASANRAAPQITQPSQAQQQSVYNAAGNFQANTSGVAGIRAATADTSGAAGLQNFQSQNSQQGVNALYGFRPDETFRSANQLEGFQATNTAEGANAVAGFNPDQVQGDAESLRKFRADQSGINRLNAYADEAQGPSAAQAMLRSQADADKRTMLAISRSGRGGPGAAVNAQRQAISEGGLISAETRGQGAALAAQETDMYKQRQLQALAQAGSLISASEAQRLQGLAQAGALMSQADAQKLSALQAYGQLKATQDSQQLSARQSAGQLNANAENMLLGATSNAAQLQGQMDQQRLAGMTAGANILLQGSAINQQGQIAATQAELQGSAQQLQALGLQGQIASDMANQSITVLRANLDATLQQTNLNDTQVRYFAGLGAQRDIANNAIQMQAAQFGVNAGQAQQSLDLQYQGLVFNQLSTNQQLEYNYNALNANTNLGLGSQAIQIAGQAQNQSQFDTGEARRRTESDRDFYARTLLGLSEL